MTTVSPNSLEAAETARVNLEHAKIADLLRDVPSYTLDELAELDETQLQEFMLVLRIKLSSFLSQFSEGIFASLAIPYLLQAKVLLDYYYAAPVIKEGAAAMIQDHNKHEYLMGVELRRDVAKYCIKLAELTGNTEMLRIAIGVLDDAGKFGSSESSAVLLARYERAMILVGIGETVDFETIVADWRAIVALAETSGGHDRAAKVSWEMKSLAKKLDREDIALEAKKMCQLHAGFLRGGYLKYAARQIVREKITTPAKRLTYRPGKEDLNLAATTIAP